MADIAGIVKYEQVFPLEILDPDTRAKTGMVFNVKHRDCDAVQEVVERHIQEDMRLAAKGERPAPEEMSDRTTRRNLERLAACVDSWAWGKDKDGEPNTYKGKPLECTQANVIMVLDEVPWLHDAVFAGTANIGNFTTGS